MCNNFCLDRSAASTSEAGTPIVLPDRIIVVMLSEDCKGSRWGWISAALVSLSDREAREKVEVEAMLAVVSSAGAMLGQ